MHIQYIPSCTHTNTDPRTHTVHQRQNQLQVFEVAHTGLKPLQRDLSVTRWRFAGHFSDLKQRTTHRDTGKCFSHIITDFVRDMRELYTLKS